ncbi:dynein axonemal assembly factor 9 [Micropterus dolomieu]|uniref:dynein axonemal assembly factor 9 n=1 Tax=Micropterus dolomieu TaxID=147949 RepID=UPI001E8E89F7|nr:dynein axonemal assembly factor 9 [Micropterus dolomieu]XP_045917901.1 dynein axonemal assembly factor 9 [Micropterus dolomieu]
MAGIRRVNGKLSGVNPTVSCHRLRQVQSLLFDGGAATPDGILCSLGIDSRYNEGCTELAKYLFYELYGRNQLNMEHFLEEFPEEMLDDVILLIKAECVHLYCNPMNYCYLLPYVSHWRNLHLYCMTEAEYEDEEAAEEFKISSFVTMVQDCYRIGVPFSSLGHIQRFDMFMVEKWPLIQAFALEGIGGGSFFTIKYKLMDMSEKLWQVYNRLDPVSLDNVLTEDLVNFEKQWSGFFSSMDLESHLSILELSEAQAGEAFRTYYSHGLISSNITDKSKSQQPFVLFGKHSSLEDLESYLFNFPSESHQVRNTGPQGSTARHMILQCVAPKGPLACSRTYFFGTTHTPYLGNQNTEQKKTEVLLLSQIYSAAVQAVLSGIKCYSCTSSATKAKDVAENTFLVTLDSLNLSQYRSSLRSKCEFSIQAVNKQGRIIPLTDEESRYVVKTASMTVHDIPDLQWDSGDLGSVVFSESFLESSINIQQKDGTVSLDSCYTILTTTVPRYACWLMESDVKQSEQAQQLTKKEEGTCLGTALTVADAAYVFSSSQLSTPEEGKIIFFSEGLLFIHSQYGSITLPKDHISSIKFYDPDSSAVASLFVEYESSLLPHLPFPLHSSDQCLVFALQPRSKSHRAFYSKILSVWQTSESGLTLQLVDQEHLTWNQKNMHTRLQKLHDSQEPPVAKRRGSLKTSYSQLPEQDMFLQHFALSSIGQEPILYDHLGVLFSSAELRSPVNCQGDKIVITIITGLPGSHKNRLCNFLVQLNKEHGSWVVYKPGSESCDSFSASHLQQYLSSFLESQRSPGGKPRLLVLSPGYTDVLDVVQAVLFHPDPVVQACFTIGAVTACVDPLTSCMEHRFAFPKLLEQCSQGIVSTVVFTGLTAEQKHPLMQHVQQLVRSANPTAAFILAERGAVTRTEDVNLIFSESSFNEPQMLRARYVLYPGWCKGRFNSGSGSLVLTQQRVAFNRPLERPLFVTRSKALKSSLRPSPFKENVYNVWGKVRFSDSDQLMEVSYNTVSGSLNIVPDQSTDLLNPDSKKTNMSYFLIFDGVSLTEDGLKDWLRLCAKQRQTKKPKKTKNTLLPQEIKRIHITRHLDPLPPGYFYNGYQYVDIFGEKRNLHPNMEEFIKEYITEANKEIELFNRQLELEGQPDLFDP